MNCSPVRRWSAEPIAKRQTNSTLRSRGHLNPGPVAFAPHCWRAPSSGSKSSTAPPSQYQVAATLLPEAAEWLTLRAAALVPDSAARARLYRTVGAEPARTRADWVEAAALERTGARDAAADRYAVIGARIDALRLRWAAATSDSARRAVRRSLVAMLVGPLNAEESRAALALLDQLPGTLSTEEQLTAARRAAAIGNAARAVRGFGAAEGKAGFSDADRLRYGISLAQMGRSANAISQFEAITDPASTGAAAYQRARLILARSGASAALPALLRVPDVAAIDTTSAGIALYLAGDLVADQGDFRTARNHLPPGRRTISDLPPCPACPPRSRHSLPCAGRARSRPLRIRGVGRAVS